MTQEPDFAFSIPSMGDDVALDCRLYNPLRNTGKKGAVMAHPYAPLGGSQDDPVVLSVTSVLLKEGYVVATFNFRGAGDSAGKTSWTGKPEIEDYSSVVGLLFYYLRHLRKSNEPDATSFPQTARDVHFDPNTAYAGVAEPRIELLLGGYSFGSLILARLDLVSRVLDRFEVADRGTAASEIFLRATTLAKQASSPEETIAPSRQRRQTLEAGGSPTSNHSRASPVMMGGEETNPSERRLSRDKRSLDIVRDVPQRLKAHIKRRSGSFPKDSEISRQAATSTDDAGTVTVDVKYLLVSPVLIPLTTFLLPPGLPFSLALRSSPDKDNLEVSSGLLALSHPTLVLFGSIDNFTSPKRLRQWAIKLEQEASGRLQWTQVNEAGHFWRETGALQNMQIRIREWLRRVQTP